MPYEFINRVGVELEGGWTDPNFLIGHDGSVNVRANVVGELASPPLLPEELEEWMAKHYPDAVNETCGMHVHVSLKSVASYSALMERPFFDFFVPHLRKWGEKKKIIKTHPFWARVNGIGDWAQRYCKMEFIPEKQVHRKDRHNDRYTALNYTWARYKTVECRLLPAFKMPKIGISAVTAVMDGFESFLKTAPDITATEREAVVFDETPDQFQEVGEVSIDEDFAVTSEVEI